MKKLIMIAITAVMVMAMEAKPFAYEKNNDGTPFLSFKSNPHTAHPTTGYAFSVAPLHSPMTGSYITRLSTSGNNRTMLTAELMMSSGSEYSSVIIASAPSLTSRPRREGENPFGDETIDDVSNPQDPGSPIGQGTWFLLLLAAAYAAFLSRRRMVVQAECIENK